MTAAYEAVVRLRLRGSDGFESDIDAVVDTGYSGSLMMPPSMAAALGLIPQLGGRITLDDGTVRGYDSYRAEMEWGLAAGSRVGPPGQRAPRHGTLGRA